MSKAIGVDVGATTISAGLVEADGTLHASRSSPTPLGGTAEVVDQIVRMVRDLCSLEDPVAVGVGVPGFVDERRETVRFAANLGWRNSPLRRALAQRIALPISLENDANAAGWAETKFGAGRGTRQLVLITAGTGIGAAVVVDGKLCRGRYGIAGEPGHMVVVPQGLAANTAISAAGNSTPAAPRSAGLHATPCAPRRRRNCFVWQVVMQVQLTANS